MKSLLNPKWIFLINTLPIIILSLLAYSDFKVIKPLLSHESIGYWKDFSIFLIGFAVLNFGYAIYLISTRQKVNLFWAVCSLITHIVFIYSYGVNADQIIPFDIPEWMLTGDLFLYVGTFLMPSLFYSVIIAVLHFTPEHKNNSLAGNFLVTVAIPFCVYIFSQLILPLWRITSSNFEVHFYIVLFISATVFFVFFLVRTLYILIKKKLFFFKKYRIVFKVIFCVFLPVLGLLINQGYFIRENFGNGGDGFFGDFSNYWFFVLAFGNGILLCIPEIGNKNVRLLLYFLKAVTFSFTFYFFLVFLPVLPISAIAVIAIGFGFLMLSPLILFVFHVMDLHVDFSFLRSYYSGKNLAALFVLGIFIIPGIITFNYYQDKKTLNSALEYIYSPDYNKEYEINAESLRNTLAVINAHKGRPRDLFMFGKTPYLSAYYNWLVLDNLTLSEKKRYQIQRVFLNSTANAPTNSTRDFSSSYFELSNAIVKTKFDEKKQTYISWLILEIKNKSENDTQEQFSTSFYLPETAFISNYYLEIEGKKEYGILAEKKSALWTFHQIINFRRDPGILYYLSGNKIAFEIFPFLRGETRRTGIEFIHKEPLSFEFYNKKIQLGNPQRILSKGFENEKIKYISSNEKDKFSRIRRSPYFCFLVDNSQGKEQKFEEFLSRIATFTKQYPQFAEGSEIRYVNSYVSDKKQKFRGGYFLDRAIRKELISNYEKGEKRFPVFVSVTDFFETAILDNDFSDLEFAYPDNDFFYNLKKGGSLEEHSLSNSSEKVISENAKLHFENSVVVYKIGDKTYFLKNNSLPQFVLKDNNTVNISDEEFVAKDFNSASLLFAENRLHLLHPETADKSFIKNVKHSFQSQVMTPLTSYISVENEAQKNALLRKQKHVLSGNKNLDLEEEIMPMSEPGTLILAIGMLVFIWFKTRRKNRFATLKNQPK